MISADELIEAYGAAWHEPDPAARAELLARCWAADGAYRDPTVAIDGREALAEHMGGFQARLPGHRLVLRTAIDEHHRWLRFGWRMLDPGGAAVLEGLDIGERDADGRLARIVGFFGPLPASDAE